MSFSVFGVRLWPLGPKEPEPGSLPSMEDSMSDLSDVPKQERPGLEVKFIEGENIPWKGIWFTVSKVEKAQLTLVPENMTWKRAKRLQEANDA